VASVKTVLIVGGSGFVGSNLALKLRQSYKVFTTFFKHKVLIPGVTSIPFDLDKDDWVKRIVYAVEPDVVIFAAGNNDAQWAENNTKAADNLHTGGMLALSNASEIFQAKTIYLSNNYVFDGNKGNYFETDSTLPSIHLGKAKVGGENFLKGRSLNWVVFRCAPLIGRSNGQTFSFMDTLRTDLDRGRRVELSVDEIHNFALIDGLIEAVKKVIDVGYRAKIFHYGGLSKMTWFDFGQAFARKFGYNPNLIQAASPLRKRPLDLSLNCSNLIDQLKIQPLLLEQSFDQVEQKLISAL